MNLIVWLITGGLIGWVASMIMRTDTQQGILLNIIVGIVVAFLGGLIADILGLAGNIDQNPFSPLNLIFSLLSAIILLGAIKLFSRAGRAVARDNSGGLAPRSVTDTSVQSTRQTQQPVGATPVQPAPQPAWSGPQMIFISYRRDDTADVTGRIYDRLVQRFGEDAVFKDVDSIPPGVNFQQHLAVAIAQCSLLLAVIGRQWLTIEDRAGQRRLNDPRDFVRIELETALQRGIPIIPLLVQGTTVPPPDQLPAALHELSYRNSMPIRPDPDFRNDMDRLIQAVERYLTQQRARR